MGCQKLPFFSGYRYQTHGTSRFIPYHIFQRSVPVVQTALVYFFRSNHQIVFPLIWKYCQRIAFFQLTNDFFFYIHMYLFSFTDRICTEYSAEPQSSPQIRVCGGMLFYLYPSGMYIFRRLPKRTDGTDSPDDPSSSRTVHGFH